MTQQNTSKGVIMDKPQKIWTPPQIVLTVIIRKIARVLIPAPHSKVEVPSVAYSVNPSSWSFFPISMIFGLSASFNTQEELEAFYRDAVECE